MRVALRQIPERNAQRCQKREGRSGREGTDGSREWGEKTSPIWSGGVGEVLCPRHSRPLWAACIFRWADGAQILGIERSKGGFDSRAEAGNAFIDARAKQSDPDPAANHQLRAAHGAWASRMSPAIKLHSFHCRPGPIDRPVPGGPAEFSRFGESKAGSLNCIHRQSSLSIKASAFSHSEFRSDRMLGSIET